MPTAKYLCSAQPPAKSPRRTPTQISSQDLRRLLSVLHETCRRDFQVRQKLCSATYNMFNCFWSTVITRRLQKPSITLCLCRTHAPPTANIISKITTSDLNAAKQAMKNSTPPGTAGLAEIWSPDLGPDKGTRGPETVSQSWTSVSVPET